MIILMYSSAAGILMYACLHTLFALQYLRASMTVPLHFERRRRLDTNYNEMLNGLDNQIRRRSIAVKILQLIFGLATLTVIFGYALPKCYEYAISRRNESDIVWFENVMKSGVWKPPLVVLGVIIFFFNFLSSTLVGISFRLVKKWINEELDPFRRWRCIKDGLFLIYFFFQLMLSISAAFMTVELIGLDV